MKKENLPCAKAEKRRGEEIRRVLTCSQVSALSPYKSWNEHLKATSPQLTSIPMRWGISGKI